MLIATEFYINKMIRGWHIKIKRAKPLEPVGIEPASNNRTDLLIYLRPSSVQGSDATGIYIGIWVNLYYSCRPPLLVG
jgi:hypothetical protein